MRLKPQRSGTAAIKLLVCLIVIVAVMALNLDGGRMIEERRRVQCAADAAALAAAKNLYLNYWTYHGTDTTGTAKDAAVQSAISNGISASDVTVNIPPTSGAYAGQPGIVEVIIESQVSACFGRIFHGDNYTVAGRTVCRGEPLKIGIIALSPSGADRFVNSALVTAVVNKPIIVNSNDASAFHQMGLASLIVGELDVTGGIVNTGISLNLGKTRTGVRPTLDPLAFLPIPDQSVTVRSHSPMTINSLLPTILQPGIYRGGIYVTGSSIVVMNPGTYIMEGGGFRVDNLATVTGLGITIYNASSSIYAAGPISINGLGKIVLTAPLSGVYQGINFFQQRNLTQPISITGLGLTTITGVVYAASASANITGSAAVGLDILGGAYVVNSFNSGGIGAVTVNIGLNPPRIPDVRIIE